MGCNETFLNTGDPLAVPGKTILYIPEDEQELMLRSLRRSRYGFLLSLHVLLLCARGMSPSRISESLFCSRSSVYRIVDAYCRGALSLNCSEDGDFLLGPVRTTVLLPRAEALSSRSAEEASFGLRLVSDQMDVLDTLSTAEAQPRCGCIGRDNSQMAP